MRKSLLSCFLALSLFVEAAPKNTPCSSAMCPLPFDMQCEEPVRFDNECQYEGAQGIAMATRSGKNNGITMAEIVAGFLVVAIITVGALILTNNSPSRPQSS
jgi:hypothetical protein